MSELEHNVSVRFGSSIVEKWQEYQIDCDMLQPADAFRVALGGASRDVVEMCKPDTFVEVMVDDTPIVNGLIDERTIRADPDGGATVDINGRDKGGRLVDESAPLTSFAGLGVKEFAQAMVGDWFNEVRLSNAENRRLVRGKGARVAKVSSEPPIITGKNTQKKVQPGETRWHALAHVLQEAELLGWSSADGKAFIIGLPNYDQEPQYSFFLPEEDSAREREGNVERLELVDSVAERYSKIVACGSAKGAKKQSKTGYSGRVTGHRGEVRNWEDDPDGVGKDFTARKVLLVSDDDVRNDDLAEKRARREMAERDASARRVRLTVKGHGQTRGGGAPALYAFDTIAWLGIEMLELIAPYLITSVTFRRSFGEGARTDLNLVPRGTLLKL